MRIRFLSAILSLTLLTSSPAAAQVTDPSSAPLSFEQLRRLDTIADVQCPVIRTKGDDLHEYMNKVSRDYNLTLLERYVVVTICRQYSQGYLAALNDAIDIVSRR